MGDKDSLDLMGLVAGEDLLIGFKGRARTPARFDDHDVQPMAPAHVDPAMAEHSVAGRKDPVAGTQSVGERGFPPARAGGGENENLGSVCFQDFPYARQGRAKNLREQRRPVVERRHVDCLAQQLRHIGRAGYEDGILHIHVGVFLLLM